MKNFIINTYHRFEHLIKYCLIGCTGAGIDFLVYTLLVTQSNIHYQYINIFSTSLGIINNYFLNSFFNFKVKDHSLLRLLSFYMVGSLGIAVTAGILFIFIELLHFNPVFSKIVTIFAVTVFQFLLNKFITFRNNEKNNGGK